jgi:hypothetical protein
MSTYDQGHGGNSPHRSLLSAVVLQAVQDLDDKDETVKWEANEFFLAERGGWADMRKFYFGALGLDEARVLTALGSKLTAPERPSRRWLAEDLFKVLPMVPFTVKEVLRLTQMGYTQVRGRLETLEHQGLVLRIGRGEFCRTSHLPPPSSPSSPTVKRSHLTYAEVRKIIHGLLAKPHSFKDLIIATNGDVGDSKIRDVLRNGLLTFELSRSDDGRYLLSGASRPQTPVFALVPTT